MLKPIQQDTTDLQRDVVDISVDINNLRETLVAPTRYDRLSVEQVAISCFKSRDLVLEGSGGVFYRAQDEGQDFTSMLP